MTDLPNTYASVDTDMNADELMCRHDICGRPLLTPGDGNCLFNSISIILTLSTKMASELRYNTCIQMATRKDRVLEGHRNIDDLFIVSPDYDQSLIACARDTEFSSAWIILGLSQVLQRKVISVYPPENGPCDATVQILTTVFGSFQHEWPLSILWMGPKKGKGKMWLPNHFLPIAPDSSVDAGVDDDYADNEIESDTGDDDEEETSKVTSSSVVLHDSDETETDDETCDSDDLTGMCSKGKALPSDNFLPVDEVLDVLTGDTLETVHVSVPLGRKENVWFLLDNSDNVIRRKGGKNINTGMTVGRGVMERRQVHHLHCTQDKMGMPYMLSKEKENIVKRSSQIERKYTRL